MDKQTLLTAIRAGHASIEQALTALSDQDLLGDAPGMPGWTRKDVLAHLEWWHDHSSNVLEGVRTGVDPYPAPADEPWDLDAHNARVFAENRDRAPSDVRAGEASSFVRLVAAVGSATDEELFAENPRPWLDGTAAEEVANDSSLHYPEHVPHLG
jgi:hypothetical protein